MATAAPLRGWTLPRLWRPHTSAAQLPLSLHTFLLIIKLINGAREMDEELIVQT